MFLFLFLFLFLSTFFMLFCFIVSVRCLPIFLPIQFGRNRRKCSLFCLTLIKITYTSPNHGFMVTGKEKFEKLRD
ncbi:CAS_1a_G0013310.mRNA.1.CDS.1 [Saccharomyces cerevisiae]|nr:CAS_1a_G0013310.mRNA.1.CDS.1 [Saccharomyces cerevisiae]CAI7229500.1 CAS_1a_G0013310.mRNA.1.CDS.1 [Saccharomyces cerevisiae]